MRRLILGAFAGLFCATAAANCVTSLGLATSDPDVFAREVVAGRIPYLPVTGRDTSANVKLLVDVTIRVAELDAKAAVLFWQRTVRADSNVGRFGLMNVFTRTARIPPPTSDAELVSLDKRLRGDGYFPGDEQVIVTEFVVVENGVERPLDPSRPFELKLLQQQANENIEEMCHKYQWDASRDRPTNQLYRDYLAARQKGGGYVAYDIESDVVGYMIENGRSPANLGEMWRRYRRMDFYNWLIETDRITSSSGPASALRRRRDSGGPAYAVSARCPTAPRAVG